MLFYGDHLPALSDSYHITGFVDGQDMLSQAGTWLLVDPHSEAEPIQQDTAAWLLPGKLLAQAGIQDDAYFALTTLVGPQLAALPKAPGAMPLAEDSEQQRIDQAMASVNQLRMNGKLDPLLPKLELLPTGGIAHNNAVVTNPPASAALQQ